MPDPVEVRVNDVGDILYLRFLEAKIATSAARSMTCAERRL